MVFTRPIEKNIRTLPCSYHVPEYCSISTGGGAGRVDAFASPMTMSMFPPS